jgi:hypothetical protein
MWVGRWGFVWCVCVDVGFVCFVQLMFNSSNDDVRRGELRASGCRQSGTTQAALLAAGSERVLRPTPCIRDVNEMGAIHLVRY